MALGNLGKPKHFNLFRLNKDKMPRALLNNIKIMNIVTWAPKARHSPGGPWKYKRALKAGRKTRSSELAHLRKGRPRKPVT